MARKSMIWMNSKVSPAARLAHRVHQVAQAGHETVVADAQERPARHVADAGGLDDDAPRPAVGEASYQSMTSGVTRPSSVARQGTIAGTQVRVRAVRPPMARGENSAAARAWSALGQWATGRSCLRRSGGCHMRAGVTRAARRRGRR
jgi:hypothetical protein